MARAALEPIEAQFPEWQPSDHPDLTHWSGPAEWVGNQSPWSPDQLLARKPSEQLEELLTFKGSLFHGPDRAGLIKSIQEACKQDLSWTFELAETMIERSLWSSDLWIAVIRGWQEADMEVDSWNSVMSIVAKPELHTAHPTDVASLLYAIVRDGGKSFALDLLQRANAIALLLWRILDLNQQNEVIDDWLSRAINRPAGIIVEFWISGLSLLLRDKSGANRTLPDDYREWFTMVVQDPSSRGGLGRSLLASQTAFLFDLDEAWTEQHIVPLFSDKDREKFAQAWDGFLVWGRLYPRLADALTPSFISAVARLSIDLPNHHHRFIEFYTGLAVFHISDPTEQLLPSLFQHGSVKDRISFAQQLGYLLRQMKPTARKDLWNRWLFHYWQERQQAVPAKLDEGEIQGMLDWLLAFDELFPEAVRLAILSPAIRIENSRLLYELRESDLVTRFPAETAELLIYLCYCVVGYLASELAAVAVRLPALTPDLRYRLNEALAHCGAT